MIDFFKSVVNEFDFCVQGIMDIAEIIIM